MEKIKGEVQAIRKDKKAVEVLGIWYNSRFKVLDNIEKGDIIEINYTVNKGFNNIKDYEVFDKCAYVEDDLIAEEGIKEIKSKTPDTTINTLIMCIKDIYNNNIACEQDIKITDVTKDIIDCYKLIIANI